MGFVPKVRQCIAFHATISYARMRITRKSSLVSTMATKDARLWRSTAQPQARPQSATHFVTNTIPHLAFSFPRLSKDVGSACQHMDILSLSFSDFYFGKIQKPRQAGPIACCFVDRQQLVGRGERLTGNANERLSIAYFS